MPDTVTEPHLGARRVRHSLLPARWPTREEAAAARWFSPIRLGKSVVARERTWVPAMVPWCATEDGFVTQDVLDWYARFAPGRPGVLVVEATGIRDVRSGPLLRIGDDRFIPGLRQLVDVVREQSRGETRLFILTNYCEGLDQRHKQVTCKLWDRSFTPGDGSVQLASDGKRRLVAPPSDVPER